MAPVPSCASSPMCRPTGWGGQGTGLGVQNQARTGARHPSVLAPAAPQSALGVAWNLDLEAVA